jgi:hypothetical protein
MSVRTGTKSGFPAVFDAPDCGAIVERRSVSTAVPQALFFMNDAFTGEQARSLAQRVMRKASNSSVDDQIRAAYRIVFGRSPNDAEFAIGLELLATPDQADRLERYCQLILSANELIYID